VALLSLASQQVMRVVGQSLVQVMSMAMDMKPPLPAVMADNSMGSVSCLPNTTYDLPVLAVLVPTIKGMPAGHSVSSAGDVNGDGLDDLIVGARAADPSNKLNAGKSYVVFGKKDRAVSFLPNTTYDFPTLYFLIAYILPPVSAV
jgi:hypothetical protein